ncbi:g8968 [Coccomyxa viridis]|uniref:G8968 protein n=1 Tax=Coccomyxa viridis TaxID=1274662 RepID=A0ABP1G1R8_9CHLO
MTRSRQTFSEMSVEALGSLAQTVSDRYLRENFRRVIAGTNMSVASVMDGFRDASRDVCMPLRSEVDHAPGPSRASAEIARGSSFSRNGSEHLKKRNTSVRTSLNGNVRRGMLQQHPGGQLQSIRASTSLGPVSPRTARKLSAKGRKACASPRARLVLGLGIAMGLLALCIISGYMPPPLSGFGMLKSFLAGTLAPSSTRRLLSSKEESLGIMPTSLEPQHDAYTVRHRQHTETFHASRWDSHMAGRMSRQLAESALGAAGATAVHAGSRLAEAPNADVVMQRSGSVFPPSARAASGYSDPSPTRTGDGSSSIESTHGLSAHGSSSTDLTASAALIGQHESFRNAEGIGSVGSSGGVSGDSTISGVSFLQQPDASSLGNQLASGSGTNTLQYSNGYARIGGDAYKVMEHTQNAAQCAASCANDAKCVAWTRVAGGRADVQSCYLMSSLSNGAAEASSSMRQTSKAVSYVDPVAVMLESGTRNPSALPGALYGCPYPSSQGGECRPPASCNCYQGACYGTC